MALESYEYLMPYVVMLRSPAVFSSLFGILGAGVNVEKEIQYIVESLGTPHSENLQSFAIFLKKFLKKKSDVKDLIDILKALYVSSIDGVNNALWNKKGEIDPFLFWKTATLINPYTVIAYRGCQIGMKPNSMSNFWKELQSTREFSAVPDNLIDEHLHLEAVLYPDQVVNMLVDRRNNFTLSLVSDLAGKLSSLYLSWNDWVNFPHNSFRRYISNDLSTLAIKDLSQKKWEKMILGAFSLLLFLWDFSEKLRLDNDSITYKGSSSLVGRRDFLLDVELFMLGAYISKISSFVPTCCSWQEKIWESTQKVCKQDKKTIDVLPDILFLIMSNLVWASFTDSRVKGLGDFSSKLFRHPLKILVQRVREKNIDLSKEYMLDALNRVYDERLERKEVAKSSVSVRVSLSKERLVYYYKELADEFYRRYGVNLRYVLHYRKLSSAKELFHLLQNIKQPYKDENVKSWVEKTSDIFDITYLRQTYRNMAELVIGFDAASREMWTPLWLFAPFYSFWYTGANRLFDSVYMFSYATFHAGEDFLDIVTGLRNIYDAYNILFRTVSPHIGHGLALGADPFRLGMHVTRVNRLYYFLNIWFLLSLSYKGVFEHRYIKEANDTIEGIIKQQWRSTCFKNFDKQGSDNEISESIERLCSNYEYAAKLYDVLQYALYDAIDGYGSNQMFKKAWYLANNIKGKERDVSTVKDILYILSKNMDCNDETVVSPIFPVSVVSSSVQKEIVEIIEKWFYSYLLRGMSIEVCSASNMLIRNIPSYMVHPLFENFHKSYVHGTDDPMFHVNTLGMEYLFIRGLPKEVKE